MTSQDNGSFSSTTPFCRRVRDLWQELLQNDTSRKMPYLSKFDNSNYNIRNVYLNTNIKQTNKLYNSFDSDSDLVITGLQVDSHEARAREIAYRLYLAPDPIQDITLSNLLDARQEMASICGFRCYADR